MVLCLRNTRKAAAAKSGEECGWGCLMAFQITAVEELDD
jgi:hypothetical protein